MRFSAIALAAAVPAFVSAASQTINVGANGGLTFTPPSMNASVGDEISFVFQSKNHSVVASTFADPCNPTNASGAAFSSGFMPVPANTTQFQSYTINVTQTAPIWFYCAQTMPVNHCQMGMVGAINPTADKTLDAFKAKAMSNSSAAATSSGASPSATQPNGAVRMSGGAAGLLTLVGIVAGVAL